jgi:hypothetical protein
MRFAAPPTAAVIIARDAAPGRKRRVPRACPPVAIRRVVALARCAGTMAHAGCLAAWPPEGNRAVQNNRERL